MLVMVRSFSGQKLNNVRPFKFSLPVPRGPSTPFHLEQSVPTLALKSPSRMSVLCLVDAGKSGGVCADDCVMLGGVVWEVEFHQPLAHWCWEVW